MNNQRNQFHLLSIYLFMNLSIIIEYMRFRFSIIIYSSIRIYSYKKIYIYEFKYIFLLLI